MHILDYLQMQPSSFHQYVSNVISAIGFSCKQRATMIVKVRYNKTKKSDSEEKKEALSHSLHSSCDCVRFGLLTLLSEEELACVPLWP